MEKQSLERTVSEEDEYIKDDFETDVVLIPHFKETIDGWLDSFRAICLSSFNSKTTLSLRTGELYIHHLIVKDKLTEQNVYRTIRNTGINSSIGKIAIEAIKAKLSFLRYDNGEKEIERFIKDEISKLPKADADEQIQLVQPLNLQAGKKMMNEVSEESYQATAEQSKVLVPTPLKVEQEIPDEDKTLKDQLTVWTKDDAELQRVLDFLTLIAENNPQLSKREIYDGIETEFNLLTLTKTTQEIQQYRDIQLFYGLGDKLYPLSRGEPLDNNSNKEESSDSSITLGLCSPEQPNATVSSSEESFEISLNSTSFSTSENQHSFFAKKSQDSNSKKELSDSFELVSSNNHGTSNDSLMPIQPCDIEGWLTIFIQNYIPKRNTFTRNLAGSMGLRKDTIKTLIKDNKLTEEVVYRHIMTQGIDSLTGQVAIKTLLSLLSNKYMNITKEDIIAFIKEKILLLPPVPAPIVQEKPKGP